MADIRLLVSDLQATRRFLSWHLGFRETERPEDDDTVCVLQNSTAQVTLKHAPDAAAAAAARAAPPFILLTSMEGVRAAFRSLQTLEARAEEVPIDDGVGFLTETPDGHRFIVAARTTVPLRPEAAPAR